MKPTTKVWYLCESVGKPEHNLKGEAEVRIAAVTIGRWLFESYMGDYIRITLARNEAELIQKSSVGRKLSKADELAAMEAEFMRLADAVQPE